jgi:hypothetical protein
MNFKQQQFAARQDLFYQLWQLRLGDCVFVLLEDGFHHARIQGFKFAHEQEELPLEHTVNLRMTAEGKNLDRIPIWKIKKC